MFQKKKKGRKKSGEEGDEEGEGEEGYDDEEPEDFRDDDVQEDLDDEEGEETEQMPRHRDEDEGVKWEWGKKVDPDLRKWISAKMCRRDILDEHFNNPEPRKCESFLYLFDCADCTQIITAPTFECCDNCLRLECEAVTAVSHRPVTPPPRPTSPCTPNNVSPVSSAHSTPSKERNPNGKRPMVPATNKPKRSSRRGGEHLTNARLLLEHWRFKTKRDCYTLGSLTASAILPDSILRTLASHKNIKTLDDMKTVLNPPWILMAVHGQEVIHLLQILDKSHMAQQEANKKAKADVKKAATARKNEEKKAREDAERQEKRRASALLKENRDRERAAEKARQDALKEALKEEKRRQAALSAKPKRSYRRKEVLIGSSSFNLNQASPAQMPSVSGHLSVSVFQVDSIFLIHILIII